KNLPQSAQGAIFAPNAIAASIFSSADIFRSFFEETSETPCARGTRESCPRFVLPEAAQLQPGPDLGATEESEEKTSYTHSFAQSHAHSTSRRTSCVLQSTHHRTGRR